jgi:hypothetical protein
MRYEQEFEYPEAYEKQMGCGHLIFGTLLGIDLGFGVPIVISVIGYHVIEL